MVYVYNRFQTKKSQELYTLCVLLLYGLYKGVPPPRVLTTYLVREQVDRHYSKSIIYTVYTTT